MGTAKWIPTAKGAIPRRWHGIPQNRCLLAMRRPRFQWTLLRPHRPTCCYTGPSQSKDKLRKVLMQRVPTKFVPTELVQAELPAVPHKYCSTTLEHSGTLAKALHMLQLLITFSIFSMLFHALQGSRFRWAGPCEIILALIPSTFLTRSKRICEEFATRVADFLAMAFAPCRELRVTRCGSYSRDLR